MENMIKRVDLAIVDAVDQIMAGETGFFNTYGLAEGAMAWSHSLVRILKTASACCRITLT